MGSLGDFGVARPAVDEAFGWFGATIRVNPDASDLAFLDLARSMSALATQAQASDEAAKDVWEQLHGIATLVVHEDDVDTFWRLAKENRQTVDDLLAVALKIIEALAKRPTKRPADSSAGPQNTNGSSTDGSSSPALDLLEGRPDLQVVLLRNAG